MIFQNRKKTGFSLIEIMVIISIVVIGMIGVLALLLQDMKAQSINKNSFIAYQMAQEGIEIVRATRDLYSVNNSSFPTSTFWGNDYIYTYSSANPLIKTSGANNETAVCADASGFYRSCTTTAETNSPSTIFKRVVHVTAGTDADSQSFTRVIATVTWSERGKNYSYSWETHLYDWY